MPDRPTSFGARTSDDIERIKTKGRSWIYLALGVVGTLAALSTGSPWWWVVPVLDTVGGLTAYIPALYLWRTGRLPKGQGYVAIIGDLATIAALQFVSAYLYPPAEPIVFTSLVCLGMLVVTGSGLRLDSRLIIFTTISTLAVYLAYVIVHPGFGRPYAFALILCATGFAYEGLWAIVRAAERDALSRFLSPAVAERIARDPRGLDLGGKVVEATVMFTDLRGFTSYAESREPAEVMTRLNELHAIQVAAVFGQGGTVNKFTGDGMLAIFGAPAALSDDPGAAALAALEIVAGISALGDAGGEKFRVGIGLHRGRVIAGNVGSALQLEYTVIGDVVNVAARLEALTRPYDRDILISNDVAKLLGCRFMTEPLGASAIKGRAAQLEVHALLRKA